MAQSPLCALNDASVGIDRESIRRGTPYPRSPSGLLAHAVRFHAKCTLFHARCALVPSAHLARNSTTRTPRIGASRVETYTWLCALRAGVGIGKGFIVAAVLSGIGTVLLGVLLYHERISGPALIGVVLGILAIAFLAAG